MGTASPSVVVLAPVGAPAAVDLSDTERMHRQVHGAAGEVRRATTWTEVADTLAAATGAVGVVDGAYVGHASPVGDTVADSRWGSAVLDDVEGVRGVLRVGPGDLAAALDAARELAAAGAARRTSLLVARLEAAGVPLHRVDPGPYVVGFADDAGGTSALARRADALDEHRLRLAASARSGDGFYSTFVLRRVSRWVTALALRVRLRPDPITALSLLVGLVAAALFAVGSAWALVAGAVLLQVSLVLDCVDGEVARYTRQYSAFGAWLDAVSDRVKEFAAYAGLAVGAARSGEDLWLLAGAALALLVVRHHVDFGFALRQDAGSVTEEGGGLRAVGRGAARLSERTNRRTALMWAKRVVIMPIGERWLVISVVAALLGAREVFVALLATGVVAALYTTTGRVLRSMSERVAVTAAARRDLALLAEAPLLVRSEPALAWVGGRLAWLLPAAARVVECTVVLVVAAQLGTGADVAAYLVLAVVGLHLYDLVYRLRHLRTPPATWASSAVLGSVLRPALLAVMALAGTAAFVVLAVAIAALVMAVSAADGHGAWSAAGPTTDRLPSPEAVTP
ncbi:MAG: CDP-alcohol phosphatidyltransferase family protein [Jiangellaceae bacterium]